MVDIFWKLNGLNLQLQGFNENVFRAHTQYAIWKSHVFSLLYMIDILDLNLKIWDDLKSQKKVF